ncbi:MAG: hypothetical protein OEN56_12370, partial [Gemmatimonadota bacterium]|nr:hypothetical protein [Gemmatimonadota bacterium]
MIPRLVSLLVALLAPALAGPAESVRVAVRANDSMPADTILRTDLDLPAASVRAGLAARESEPHVRLGLRRIRVEAEPLGGFRLPATLVGQSAIGLHPGLRVTPLSELVLRSRAEELGRSDLDVFLPPAPMPRVGVPSVEGGRFVTEYADLALNVRSRMELGGDWTRFEPCDANFGVGCNPTLIPQLSPDVQFGVQVDGTILDRIQVDVDFDQSREFDAANRINIFYEGGEDDVLQRLEVGDVTFDLPQSRFLTEGIPAGNFGFQAAGQVGAFDIQTVWAQQRGDLNSRVFQLTGLGDQRAFVQEDTLELDDADYVRGQFFFLVDPSQIERYPHIDALELDPASAPITVAPGDQALQLYRFEDDPVFRQQVEGFIQADAVATDTLGVEVRESGWFRYLQQGLDYFVHPSGLWIALRQPLSREEMLAVAYITASGDTIGDYNPELTYNQGGRPELRLLKASGANHQPGRPTWDLEMHQVYRVSGSGDVEPGSVDLSISLGELSAGRTFKRRPSGQDITFLRLFGLDEQAPADILDDAFVYSPGEDFFEDQPPVQGTFVFFPTLRPFAEPPPIPSLGLTETVTRQIVGDDANPRIYFEEDPFERDNGGRFRLTLAYRIRSEGLISSFSLGAFGIRDGSERILLGDRVLTRGVDYEIDYDVGQVRLLDPDLLFASSPEASIRASWEQRSLFQITPTQVFGLRTHAQLGANGGIDVLGLYQSERSVVRRPILGTEPGSAILGGLSGRYDAPVAWFDRLLEAVPGLNFAGASTFSASGELALSVPNPNRLGRGFVDDFDGAAELAIRLRSSDWILGSAPSLRDGADAVLPPVLDETTSGSLTWQDRWVVQSVTGDSVGVHEGLFPRIDIDNQIRVAGSDIREPGLLLTLGRRASGVGQAWRSTMTPLSTNGLDLTKTEFLEFYAKGDQTISLVIDLGVVSEDGFFVREGDTDGTRSDGRPWGLGRLDQEADPRLGEIWNDTRDQLGVWDESCVTQPGRIFFIGDVRANCTRGNGRPDTEDLDADGNLDTTERHLRYLVTLDGSSPFLARSTIETGTDFQLYRVPIRGGAAVEVGGAISEADLRAVRHLRVTATGPSGQVQLARMRLIGSRWIKRAGEGVLEGIIGDTLSGTGRLEVAAVSRVTEGDEYASPPGVLAELVDPTQALGGQGIEFNEKSLGVLFEDLPSEARAEVYYRFPQRPQDFLTYREARLWVVARSGDFGQTRPNYFFFKVGSDPENFYLYRSPLPAPGGGGVTAADWLPEIVVDFDVWLDLRRRAEESLSFAPRAPGDPPVEIWSADSTYAVVLGDRGRAPNLAAVREISLGVWNETLGPTNGEVWVDELRLARPVRDAGLASSVNVELDGAGVITTRLNITDRGAFFRQLRDDPTYQNDRNVNLFSSLAVDRWLPSEWGLDVPVSFELSRSSQDPVLLANSDLRAGQIASLRDTEARRRRVGMALRKRTRTANPVVGFVVDGLDLRASYSTA